MIKQISITIILVCCFGYSYTQNTVSGYYLTNTNDTLNTQIKLPKSIFGSVDLSKLLFRVEVTDSVNGAKKLKPEDIKGFGFLYNGENYTYFSQPFTSEKNLRFLQPVILGTKTNLYQGQTVNQNGSPLGTFYTFQKADGTYAFLNTGMLRLSEFRATLIKFYKDEKHIQELIETKFLNRISIKNDILEIVQLANQ